MSSPRWRTVGLLNVDFDERLAEEGIGFGGGGSPESWGVGVAADIFVCKERERLRLRCLILFRTGAFWVSLSRIMVLGRRNVGRDLGRVEDDRERVKEILAEKNYPASGASLYCTCSRTSTRVHPMQSRTNWEKTVCRSQYQTKMWRIGSRGVTQ